MMMTKLCPHLIGGSGDGLRLCREARSPVVKLVDDFGPARDYAALPHKPLIVGRVTQAREIDPNALLMTPPQIVAQDYFGQVLWPHISANPLVQAWEGPNEVVCQAVESMAWFSQFETRRVELLSAVGKQAVVGNFGVGQPEPHLWAHFHEAILAANRYNGFVGVHEYSEPSRGVDTWYMGRLTRIPYQCRVIVTECGTDSLPPVPEDGSQPQRHPAGKPWRQQFNGDVNAYAEFLLKYDAWMQTRPEVVGATIFTFGGLWPDHNVEGSGLADILIRRTASAPPPPPPVVDGATHEVSASVLNVRAHPWTGNVIPPRTRTLARGARVTVYGEYRKWGCISPDGNEWVSLTYLRAL